MNPDGTINWLYIFVVLLIRFVGVFVVLGILMLGITLSGKIITKIEGIGRRNKSSGK